MTVAAYRDRATGRYPISLDDIRRSAGMLFGDEPTPEVLEFVGVDPVTATAPPVYDPAVKSLAEGAPGSDGSGYFQTWVVTDLPPPPVPFEIGPLQFRRAIRAVGMKPALDAFVASLDEEGRETIEYATAIRRDDPLIELARIELGWAADQVDDLFRLASTL